MVPNESAQAFAYAYNGIRKAFFELFRLGAVRLCVPRPGHSCAFCEQLLDIQSAPEVAIVLADPRERLPVKAAGCDNTTKWSKFAKTILEGAKILVCYAHVSGDQLFILYKIAINPTDFFGEQVSHGRSSLFAINLPTRSSTRNFMKMYHVQHPARLRRPHVLFRPRWFRSCVTGARMGPLFGLKDTGAVSVAHGRSVMQGLATSLTTMVSRVAGPSSPWLSVGLLVSRKT
jgi:hypothetical protein